MEVQWDAPLWPEGEIKEYEVLVNSTVVMANTSADVELMTDMVQVSIHVYTCNGECSALKALERMKMLRRHHKHRLHYKTPYLTFV